MTDLDLDLDSDSGSELLNSMSSTRKFYAVLKRELALQAINHNLDISDQCLSTSHC
jgi:hypothetical protein